MTDNSNYNTNNNINPHIEAASRTNCPACGGRLVFEPAVKLMHCSSCGNYYRAEDIARYAQNFRPEVDAARSIDCNVYVCDSCGSEINVSNNECSTHCSFCGQPTVVFSRVAKMLRPDYIIPFTVTREQALALMRQKLGRGIFVPDEIKNIQVDKINGIYVPYWLYDIDYADTQLMKVGSRSSSYGAECYRRSGHTHFADVPIEASNKLNNDSSSRLEPFDIKGIRNFDPVYLQGFYSDRWDDDTNRLNNMAIRKVKKFFDEEMEARMKEEIKYNAVTTFKNDPWYRITKAKYAFFPAWFITYRYKNTPYTILVNGQTGKVVGGVPANMNKFWGLTALLSGGISVALMIITLIMWFVASAIGDKTILSFVGGLIAAEWIISMAVLLFGITNVRRVATSRDLSRERGTNEFASKR